MKVFFSICVSVILCSCTVNKGSGPLLPPKSSTRTSVDVDDTKNVDKDVGNGSVDLEAVVGDGNSGYTDGYVGAFITVRTGGVTSVSHWVDGSSSLVKHANGRDAKIQFYTEVLIDLDPGTYEFDLAANATSVMLRDVDEQVFVSFNVAAYDFGGLIRSSKILVDHRFFKNFDRRVFVESNVQGKLSIQEAEREKIWNTVGKQVDSRMLYGLLKHPPKDGFKVFNKATVRFIFEGRLVNKPNSEQQSWFHFQPFLKIIKIK